MIVGSIQTTVEEGQSVQRDQDFGYFAFGTPLSLLSSRSATFNFRFVILRRFDDHGSL